MRGTSGMREDVGETECYMRAKSRECSDGLLAAILLHHGSPVKIEVRDDTGALRQQIAALETSIVYLQEENREQGALIKQQRNKIVLLMGSDDLECPRVLDILEVVCTFYKVTKAQIIGEQRRASLAFPRHIVCYLANQITKQSTQEIGRRLGGRDHSSILHGIRRIAKQIEGGDVKLIDDIDVLMVKIDALVLERRVVALSTAA